MANYTPKGGISADNFQLGVTRTVSTVTPVVEIEKSKRSRQDVEEPILFSAGTNSDILF